MKLQFYSNCTNIFTFHLYYLNINKELYISIPIKMYILIHSISDPPQFLRNTKAELRFPSKL